MKKILLLFLGIIFGIMNAKANIPITITVDQTIEVNWLDDYNVDHNTNNTPERIYNPYLLSDSQTNYNNYYSGLSLERLDSFNFRITGLRAGTYCFGIGFSYTNSNSTIKCYYDVTVIEPTRVNINNPIGDLKVGDSHTYEVTVSPAGVIANLSWTSSEPTIASVTNEGVVTALSTGNTTITCTTQNGIKGTTSLHVSPYLVEGMKLNYESYELLQGNIIKLIPEITPTNATNKKVQWTSTNPTVAYVSADGTVTGLAPGISIIEATTTDGSEISASCVVKVVEPQVLAVSIAFEQTTYELEQGSETLLTPVFVPSNVSTKQVTWTSSNPSVATTNASGYLTALSCGTATITATTTDGSNLSAQCLVKVTPKDLSEFDNVVYFNDATLIAGKSDKLILQLKNREGISAVQFDVYLPDGMTIKEFALAFNSEADRLDASTHSLQCSRQSDGSYRVVCQSGSSVSIAGNSGAIIDVPVKVAENMASGEYYAILKNIVLAAPNGTKYTVDSYASKINIITTTPGDVDNDGEIDVADVVLAVNYILGTVTEGINPFAVDVDGDGEVDVADVVSLVNIILYGSNTSKAPARIKTCSMATRVESSMEIAPFSLSEDGDKVTLTLDLNNPGVEYTAVQCDLKFPEGISIDLNSRKTAYKLSFNDNADRTSSEFHGLSSADQPDGSVRIICKSDNNEVIFGEEGALINVPITSDANLENGVYEFTISNIVLAPVFGEKCKPEAYTGTILVGDGGKIKDVKLYGYYTKSVLREFSSALAENANVTSINLTEAVDIDSKGSISTGNPNALVYIPEGKSLAETKNVVVGDVCENLVLTEGYGFNAPMAFVAETASYSRTLSADGWYSLCLPFAAETPDGAKVEQFESIDITEKTVTFKSGKIEADKPCIFNAKAGLIEFSATNADVSATPADLSDGNLIGTYETLAAGTLEGCYALMSNGNGFAQTSATATANPFRAFIAATSGLSKISVKHDISETTFIEEVEMQESDAQIYNLSGQKVDKDRLKKGIYISNNKKQIVK